MSVYFVAEGGLIKIGFSNDVRLRVHNIINNLRGKGEFLGCMPGDRVLEKHFHAKFAADREYGEWFRDTPAIRALIAAAASPAYPDEEYAIGSDRLQLQEERYAEEAAYFIRNFFSGTEGPSAETFEKLAEVSSIPALRLKAIYEGQVCPITAGEYAVIRLMSDAADYENHGIAPPSMTGLVVPAGYQKLPVGVRCRCIKLFTDGTDYFCCRGAGR